MLEALILLFLVDGRDSQFLERVEEYVYEQANQDDQVSSEDVQGIARRISYCESGIRNTLNRQGSSASGYFQFIDSTWEWVTGLDAPAKHHSFDVQLEAFYTLWDEGRGASHWEPSRYCWQYEEPWEHFVRP